MAKITQKPSFGPWPKGSLERALDKTGASSVLEALELEKKKLVSPNTSAPQSMDETQKYEFMKDTINNLEKVIGNDYDLLTKEEKEIYVKMPTKSVDDVKKWSESLKIAIHKARSREILQSKK